MITTRPQKFKHELIVVLKKRRLTKLLLKMVVLLPLGNVLFAGVSN